MVANQANLNVLNRIPDEWARMAQGGGGGIGLALPVAMSNTMGANYMTASSVSR